MLPDKIWTMKELCSLKIDGNPRLETEFNLPQRVIRRGTKAIFAHLNPLQQRAEVSIALPGIPFSPFLYPSISMFPPPYSARYLFYANTYIIITVMQDTLRRKVDIGTFIQMTGAVREAENSNSRRPQREAHQPEQERDKTLVRQRQLRGNQIFSELQQGSRIWADPTRPSAQSGPEQGILQSLREAAALDAALRQGTPSPRPRLPSEVDVTPVTSGEHDIIVSEYGSSDAWVIAIFGVWKRTRGTNVSSCVL